MVLDTDKSKAFSIDSLARSSLPGMSLLDRTNTVQRLPDFTSASVAAMYSPANPMYYYTPANSALQQVRPPFAILFFIDLHDLLRITQNVMQGLSYFHYVPVKCAQI